MPRLDLKREAGLLARFGGAGLVTTAAGGAVILLLDLGWGLDRQLANAAGHVVAYGDDPFRVHAENVEDFLADVFADGQHQIRGGHPGGPGPVSLGLRPCRQPPARCRAPVAARAHR